MFNCLLTLLFSLFSVIRDFDRFLSTMRNGQNLCMEQNLSIASSYQNSIRTGDMHLNTKAKSANDHDKNLQKRIKSKPTYRSCI